MGRACSTNGEKRNAYGVLVGNLEGNIQVGTVDRRIILRGLVEK
jgi:hypothetical protein